MSNARAEAKRRERRNKAIADGWAAVRGNPVLEHLARGAGLSTESGSPRPSASGPRCRTCPSSRAPTSSP